MLKISTHLFLMLLISILFSSCVGYSVKGLAIPNRAFAFNKLNHPEKGWQKLQILKEEPNAPYREIAKLIITGDGSSSEQKLFTKMRRLAGQYSADAIIFTDRRTVTRETFNGFAATINILSIFAEADDCDCCDDDYIEMEGSYNALEIEGIAIQYSPDGKYREY